ncbi:acyl-CoA N-acyltransferase [Scleroderma citrinum]
MSDHAAVAVPPCDLDHEIIVLPATGHPDRQALLDQCLRVRIDVFVHEQGFPLNVEVDQHDPTATHFLLRLLPSMVPIGTIRAVKMIGQGENQDIYYKLGRLAVLKSYRRHRFGRDLILAFHEWAKEDRKRSYDHLEVAKVVAHSQIPVKPFYSKYGYLPEGDEFDEDGAPHQKMVAYLSLQQN